MSESESDDSVMDVTVHTISPGDQIVCGMCKQPLKCSMFYSHFKYYCQQSPQFHKEKAEAKKKKARTKAKMYSRQANIKTKRQVTYINKKYANNRDALEGKIWETVPKTHFLYWSIDDPDALRRLPVKHFGFRERTLFYNYIRRSFLSSKYSMDWSNECFNEDIFKSMIRDIHPDKVKTALSKPSKNMDMFNVILTDVEKKT